MMEWNDGDSVADESPDEFEDVQLPDGGEGIEPGPDQIDPQLEEGVQPDAEPEGDDAVDDETFRAEFLRAAAGPPEAELKEAHATLEERLLTGTTARQTALAAESGTEAYGYENVVGVGIGEKTRGGRPTGRLAVTVYVVTKTADDRVTGDARVPAEVNGVPTDVVVTGELRAQPHRGYYRPAPSGVSCGHYRITAGTFGCLVSRNNVLHILSNNHVLGNENLGRYHDPVLQPGPADGGNANHRIGLLNALVPIQFGGAANYVDAATAKVPPQLVSRANRCMRQMSASPVGCARGLVVRKCGRTTQFTRGIITDCNATTRVAYTRGTAVFRDQIVVQGIGSQFSAGGDSGSLVVSEAQHRPVGLLFAGSTTHTIINKIGRVLAAFGARIIV